VDVRVRTESYFSYVLEDILPGFTRYLVVSPFARHSVEERI
jgi:hypothetical protein